MASALWADQEEAVVECGEFTSHLPFRRILNSYGRLTIVSTRSTLPCLLYILIQLFLSHCFARAPGVRLRQCEVWSALNWSSSFLPKKRRMSAAPNPIIAWLSSFPYGWFKVELHEAIGEFLRLRIVGDVRETVILLYIVDAGIVHAPSQSWLFMQIWIVNGNQVWMRICTSPNSLSRI